VNPDSSSARRPALRDRQREEVRRALLDAAEAEIAAHGLAGASIAEVARRAGVAVGTVYNHVADRDGLVRALFDDRRGRIVPGLEAAARVRADSFEAELRGFVAGVLGVFDDHATFIRIALELGRGRDPSGGGANVLAALRAATEQVLGRRGRGRVLAARHAALHAPILIGALRAIVIENLDVGGFARHADAVVDLFLDGARRR
jgi:AcrR family transcriptional regulator